MPRKQKIASSLKTTSTSSKKGGERDDNPVENEDGEERKKKSSTSTTAANRTENQRKKSDSIRQRRNIRSTKTKIMVVARKESLVECVIATFWSRQRHHLVVRFHLTGCGFS